MSIPVDLDEENAHWGKILRRLRDDIPNFGGFRGIFEERASKGMANSMDLVLLALWRRVFSLLQGGVDERDPIAILALRNAIEALRAPSELVIRSREGAAANAGELGEKIHAQVETAAAAVLRADVSAQLTLFAKAQDLADQVGRLVTEADSAHRIMVRAAESAVTKAKGREFVTAAERYERAALKWLWGALLAAGSVAVCALLSLRWATDVPLSLAHWAPRVLLTSLLMYGVFVSVRNYRALIHTAIVTRHRGSALLTFEELRPLADDQTAKELLAQAAAAMFAAQPTGFSPTSEAEEKQLVELLKTLRGKD